jgi:hypothetical protein
MPEEAVLLLSAAAGRLHLEQHTQTVNRASSLCLGSTAARLRQNPP